MSQKECSLRRKITKEIRCDYLLFLPQNYARTKKKWSLILFLHGSGERGDNLALVKKHGPAKIVDRKPSFPFIVISPQCPANIWWSTDSLIALLDDIEAKYRIDKARIYLTGLSMGGYGTWDLAVAQPARFAAIAPVCGGGNPHFAPRIKHIPTWVFHGAKDTVVPLEESQRMVDALRKCGGDARLTTYPEAGHDSWTETYDNEELYDWFLSHRLGNKTAKRA